MDGHNNMNNPFRTGCDRFSGPVPVNFSHFSTGAVPVKSKLLIPVPVKVLISVVSRFRNEVVRYKALDILCDLLSGNFNPERYKIRATDPRMGERMRI